jgi:hypothetical protein
VAVLATFRRVRVWFPGAGIDVTTGESGQFEEVQTTSAGHPFGQYLMNVFEMQNASGAYTTRERGMYGIHYLNSTGGAVDTTWTSADFAAVETAVQAFHTSLAGSIDNSCRLVEHRWYPFGPDIVQPNPPSRVTTLGVPKEGTATGAWVRQVASTVTLRTALRRHWGRFYLPLTTQMFTVDGQMSTGNVDNVANLARTMLLAAETSQGVVPVVWDRTRKQAYSVTAIEVDSVPDIIRRRRPRDPLYKKILTV